MGWNKVAVISVGLIKFGETFEKGFEDMMEEAYLKATTSVDKEFDPNEIQAAWLGTCRPALTGNVSIGSSPLPSHLALNGIPCTRVENGCGTGGSAFQMAALSIAAGLYDITLAIGVEKMRDTSTVGLLRIQTQGHPALERGIGISMFAAQGVRHMKEFGTKKEQFAKIAVKNRYNGTLDPYSHYQQEITVEDVFNSPVVTWPLNMFDCCPQTDGAAAAILCRADLAEKFTDKPIYISGMALGTDHPQLFEKRNYIEWDATIHAAKRAYQMAGIEPKDLDLAEVHDCFSITELINYEDLGFCDKGDGGKLIEEGETEIGGRIPVNPSGGLMTKGHPVGATGVAQVAEIFWQLREEVRDSGGFGNPDINEKRQVTLKKGYGLNHNIGGRGFANAAVNIFTNKKI